MREDIRSRLGYAVPRKTSFVDSNSTKLDYRAGSDAAADDARATHRSWRTWVVLCAVWLIGLGVWAVYLAAMGYAVVMLLG